MCVCVCMYVCVCVCVLLKKLTFFQLSFNTFEGDSTAEASSVDGHKHLGLGLTLAQV